MVIIDLVFLGEYFYDKLNMVFCQKKRLLAAFSENIFNFLF